MTHDPAREYVLGRAIYRLTQRAIAACNMVVSTTPIAPLTGMQNITLRVALGTVVREAIAVGRWYERNKPEEPIPLPSSRVRSPKATTNENPRFDEDKTTEPTETVARLLRRVTPWKK